MAGAGAQRTPWGAAHLLAQHQRRGELPLSTGRRREQPALLRSSPARKGWRGLPPCCGAGLRRGAPGASLGVVAPTRGKEGGSAASPPPALRGEQLRTKRVGKPSSGARGGGGRRGDAASLPPSLSPSLPPSLPSSAYLSIYPSISPSLHPSLHSHQPLLHPGAAFALPSALLTLDCTGGCVW